MCSDGATDVSYSVTVPKNIILAMLSYVCTYFTHKMSPNLILSSCPLACGWQTDGRHSYRDDRAWVIALLR